MRTIDTSDSPQTPDEIDRASVAKVVTQVELADIRMVWARAGLNVPIDALAYDWSARTFLGYDVHAHEWADDNTFFTVRAYFAAAHNIAWAEVDADSEPPDFDPDSPPDVDIAVLFELTYSVEDTTDITDHDVEHFAAFNARFNAWPYWRELAQTITNRMRIPTLFVPVLRIPGVRAPAAPAEEPTAPEEPAGTGSSSDDD